MFGIIYNVIDFPDAEKNSPFASCNCCERKVHPYARTLHLINRRFDDIVQAGVFNCISRNISLSFEPVPRPWVFHLFEALVKITTFPDLLSIQIKTRIMLVEFPLLDNGIFKIGCQGLTRLSWVYYWHGLGFWFLFLKVLGSVVVIVSGSSSTNNVLSKWLKHVYFGILLSLKIRKNLPKARDFINLAPSKHPAGLKINL